MTDQEIITAGTAPNEMQNATVMEGRLMEAMLAPFMPANGVFINTMVSGPSNAQMVPVESVEIPAGTKLYLHVRILYSTHEVMFGVANWLKIFKNHGYEEAVTMCLDVVNPTWRADPALAASVEKLPGPLAPPVHVVDSPAAMPNWNDPRPNGMYGSILGETSHDGTEFKTGPITWIKGKWASMFESIWKVK